MLVVSWNVNSIRQRLDLVVDFLARHEPDVVCLQETKVTDDGFPSSAFQRQGYSVAAAGQKSYNGVAIVARRRIRDVSVGLVGDAPDAERRLIAATVGGVRVLSAYVPNGQRVGSPAFHEKLSWLARLDATLHSTTSPDHDVVLCGDFNIAADDRDVPDPEAMRGQLHFHPDEHAALSKLLDFGLIDSFRLHHPEPGRYTWWDYRDATLDADRGMRIDYIFVSRALAPRCKAATIHAAERLRPRPSDHVPLSAELLEGS